MDSGELDDLDESVDLFCLDSWPQEIQSLAAELGQSPDKLASSLSCGDALKPHEQALLDSVLRQDTALPTQAAMPGALEGDFLFQASQPLPEAQLLGQQHQVLGHAASLPAQLGSGCPARSSGPLRTTSAGAQSSSGGAGLDPQDQLAAQPATTLRLPARALRGAAARTPAWQHQQRPGADFAGDLLGGLDEGEGHSHFIPIRRPGSSPRLQGRELDLFPESPASLHSAKRSPTSPCGTDAETDCEPSADAHGSFAPRSVAGYSWPRSSSFGSVGQATLSVEERERQRNAALLGDLKGQIAALQPWMRACLKDSLYRISRRSDIRLASARTGHGLQPPTGAEADVDHLTASLMYTAGATPQRAAPPAAQPDQDQQQSKRLLNSLSARDLGAALWPNGLAGLTDPRRAPFAQAAPSLQQQMQPATPADSPCRQAPPGTTEAPTRLQPVLASEPAPHT